MNDQAPLIVYGRATSSNVQALLWGIEELGLGYERLDFGEGHGCLDTPEFRQMNPHGKIPVLQIGETTIWETAAILRYLADSFGPDTFWPRDPTARARVDMWAEWAKHSVASAFTGPVFWQVARTRPENRQPDRIRKNLDLLEGQLNKADAVLGQSAYLCGAELTLADIHLGHVLYRYFDIDIARAPLSNLRAYYQRLTRRAPYQRTVMVSYDALRDTF